MKEELITLKNSTVQILKAKENLKKQRMFFNMKVEEQKTELNIEEVFYNDEFYADGDSYEAANILNTLFPQIYDVVSETRNQYPKYGVKRIKELTVAALKYDTTIPEEYTDKISTIVDNYFLYENCGFFKLRTQVEEVAQLEKEAKVSTEAILEQSKQATIKVGTSIANIVKPYGEVAKSQLGDAKVGAKKLMNKGSKKLIKLFENLENKTK